MNLKTLSQKYARNTHATESLQFIVQSTFPGVYTGENYTGVGTIFQV